MRPWQTEELEKLITGMEGNHKRLQGRPADWVNKVKEDTFPDDEGFKYITAKKVRDKYTKMKAWKDAKTMQEQSGFALREEDCERSINSIQVCRQRQLSAIDGTPTPVAIRVRSS